MNLDLANGRPELRFVSGEIDDMALVEQLLREVQLHTIVNLAAGSHVDRLIERLDVFIETNIIGTPFDVEGRAAVWLKEKTVPTRRFHHVSTDEVYGSLRSEGCALYGIDPLRAQFPALSEQRSL